VRTLAVGLILAGALAAAAGTAANIVVLAGWHALAQWVGVVAPIPVVLTGAAFVIIGGALLDGDRERRRRM